MNSELNALLRLRGGVVTSAEARQVVPGWVFDRAVRTRQLVRIFPRVYAKPDNLSDPDVRRCAALRYADGSAALSHTSALALWGLPAAEPRLHLITDSSRRFRGAAGLTVHRRAGLRAPSAVAMRSGFPVTNLEQSIVDAWSLPAAGDARRASVIRAMSSRMTTPERVARCVDAAIRLPGRAELLRLLDLLAAGCRSELEIWGYEHIFRSPGMPRFQWQRPVRIGARTVYLDVYAEPERVNFELDGAAWHTSPAQRERDLKRDAALAAMGIVVVRLTHQRLTCDPAGVRRAVLAILRAHPAA